MPVDCYTTSEKNILKKWNECRDGKYKHRENRGELYICTSHHKFSTRPRRRGCKVGGHVLNLWCDVHKSSPLFSRCLYLPSLATHSLHFSEMFFSLVHVGFFLLIYHMKYQPGLNHRKMMRPLFKYKYGSLKSPD